MNRARALLPSILPSLVLAGIGIFLLTRYANLPRAQSTDGAGVACCGELEKIAPRQLEFPYYSLRDGFTSTLILVNVSPDPVDLTIALHSRAGQTLLAPALTIQGLQKLSLDLGAMLNGMSADVTGDFAEGSVSVYFVGKVMPITGQLTMTNPAKNMSFESEMVDNSPGLFLLPRQQNGLWWGLGGGRDARMVVTNTSGASATADVFLDFQAERHAIEPVVFAPHETKVLSVAEMLGNLKVSPAEAPEGGITIVPRGPTPMLVAQGKITDAATGFSTTLNFLDPSLQRASALHASGLPIGVPSKGSPYAGMGTFTPHVIVRNLLGTAQTVTVTVEYPTDEGPGRTALAPLSLPAYGTQDFSLDAVMGQLPLPLAYASIRIEYTGPPGSTIGEIASIEAKGDLVVDGRLANEGDGWAGSGGNPWRLDEETDSVLFLTNMSDQSCRIGFRVDSSGTTYHVTDVNLSPHETRAIDIRKLRDAQKPDFRGNLIPAGATEGSLAWVRLENLPVMGRVAMMNRRGGMASSFQCQICPCTASFTRVEIGPPPEPDIHLPGQTCGYKAMGEYGGCWYPFWSDITSLVTWSSSNNPVAVVTNTNPKGLVTAVAGGTANITATYSEPLYVWIPPYYCSVGGYTTDTDSIPCNVVQITGAQTVWWFNGQNPSGYATTVTWTALPSGANSYSWSLLAGTDKAVLQNQSGNTIQLRGNDLSTSLNDVTVQVAATISGGTKSTTRTATIRGPKKLVPLSPQFVDQADSARGYSTVARYQIQDNFLTTLPSNVPASEEWTSSAIYDPPYTSSNTVWWVQGAPNGATLAPTLFQDLIAGPLLSANPVPTPIAPSGSNIKVFHWGQAFRVGSATPGLGARVQTDTLQYYIDKGRHLNTVSPVP